jgi:hypothetical protein
VPVGVNDTVGSGAAGAAAEEGRASRDVDANASEDEPRAEEEEKRLPDQQRPRNDSTALTGGN